MLALAHWRTTRYIITSSGDGGICPESPDGVECVGKWEEALDDGPAAGVMRLNPKLIVVAASAQSNTV